MHASSSSSSPLLIAGYSSRWKILLTVTTVAVASLGVGFVTFAIPEKFIYQYNYTNRIGIHTSYQKQKDNHNQHHRSLNELQSNRRWPLLSSIAKTLSSYFGKTSTSSSTEVTKQVLDALAKFQNVPEFDNQLWKQMVSCMGQMSTATSALNLNLMDVSNQGWSKFIQFGISNGSNIDPWGNDGIWLEYNPKPFTYNNNNTFLIVEPCNCVSNLAYYRSMVEICSINDKGKVQSKNNNSWSILNTEYVSSLVRTFSLLALGSAFFHGSGTQTGIQLDVIPIGLLALLGYQSIIQSLVPYSRLLHDLIPLNDTKTQPISGVNAVIKLSQVVLNESVYNWLPPFRNISGSIPDYYVGFAGFGVMLVDTIFPESTALQLISLLGDALFQTESQSNFITKEYEPTLRQNLENRFATIRVRDKIQLLQRGIGIGIKMFWAFYWQEEIIEGSHLTSQSRNRIGSIITPLLNRLGNSITGYNRYQFDTQFQQSINVYPGDRVCNAKQPHSKWHEQSANALIDLFLVMADLKNVLEGGSLQLSSSQDSFDFDNFLQCSITNCMSGFDDFNHVNNINNDPAIIAFNDCLPLLRNIFSEDGDTAGFSNCLLSHYASNKTYATNNGQNSNTEGVVIEYLDTCLVHNNCLLFTGFLIVYVDLECFSEGICSKYVSDGVQLQQCLSSCTGGSICTSECLLKYGSEVSPYFRQMFSCLGILVDPAGSSKEMFLNSCLSASATDSSVALTASSALLKGLSSFTSCAIESPCKSSLASFTVSAQDTSSCASACIKSGSVQTPFPFIPLPRSVSCWLDCLLKQYALNDF